MDLIRMFLLMIAPGIIGLYFYSILSRRRARYPFLFVLAISFLTYLVMITGLYFFKDIYTTSSLITSLDCLSFSRRYGIISTLVSIVISSIFALFARVIPFLRIP